MSNISKQKDRKKSKDAVKTDSGNIIKLADGHNFIILLNPEYEEGYTHWLKVGDKSLRRTCLSDLETQKGWDPEGCHACGYAKDLYEKARAFKEEGDEDMSEKIKKRAGNVKSKYSAIFQAARVGSIMERDAKTKKKRLIPNYDEIEVGKLSLSYAQLMKVFELLDSEDSKGPTEESISEWVIDLYKEKLPKKKYAEVTKVSAICEVSEDELQIEEDDVPDISEEFSITDDMEEIIEKMIEEEDEDDEEYESKPMKAKDKIHKKYDEEDDDDEEEDDEEDDDDEDEKPKKSNLKSKKKAEEEDDDDEDI